MGRRPKRKILTKEQRSEALNGLARTMLNNNGDIIPHEKVETMFREKKDSTGWRNVISGLRRRVEKVGAELEVEHGLGYRAVVNDAYQAPKKQQQTLDLNLQPEMLTQDGVEDDSIEINPDDSFNVLMRDNMVVLVNQQNRSQKIVIEGGNIF